MVLDWVPVQNQIHFVPPWISHSSPLLIRHLIMWWHQFPCPYHLPPSPHSLTSTRFFFQWWIGWLWTQSIPRFWCFNSYFHPLRLSSWSWQYVGWTYRSSLIYELLLGHNLRKGFFELLHNSLFLLYPLNRLWSWKINGCILLWQGKPIS
jgi:hypothetical protein